MINPMIDDETLDRQLRDAAPYIDDDGFTARVMARLPAARRESRWLRAMILLGLAILGSGIAYSLSGGFVREGEKGIPHLRIGPYLDFTLGAAFLAVAA